MDSEAAVIRAEMIETRAQLDQKLGQLETRAREFSPKRYARDHMPEYFVDRAIGGVLTLVGLMMALAQYRSRRERAFQLKAAMGGYSRW
jgi:hypothetical protein